MYLATVEEKIHPEDWQRAMEAALSGTRFNVECRLYRPTGEVRIADFAGDVKKDASGKPYRIFGTVQDITERKRAEDALQQTQAHFREGLRLARMGTWTSDGSSCHWSDELYKIYGFDSRNGVPSTEQFLDIIHPQDRACMGDAIKMMLVQKRECDVTTRIVRPDGVLRYVRCVGIPVVEGEVLKGFLGTAIDITEQELLNRELERQQAHLTEAQN